IPVSHRVRLNGAMAGRPQAVERAGGHPAHRRLGPGVVVVAVCRRAATHAAAVTTEAAAVAGALPSHDVNIPTPSISR
ncbi:MAG: hypothetical protein VB674_02025, partial [Vicinamibacterales bacterium]